MKNTLRSILFLLTLILPLAQTHAQSQAEMNREAAADFQKADAQLNKVYAQVMAKLDDDAALDAAPLRIRARSDSRNRTNSPGSDLTHAPIFRSR